MLNQIFVKSLSRFLPRMVLYEPETYILFVELQGRFCDDKNRQKLLIFLIFLLFLLIQPSTSHSMICYFETNFKEIFIILTLFQTKTNTYIDIIPIFVDN